MRISIIKEVPKLNIDLFLIGLKEDAKFKALFKQLNISPDWNVDLEKNADRSLIIQTSDGIVYNVVPILLTDSNPVQEVIAKTRKYISQKLDSSKIAVYFDSDELCAQYLKPFIIGTTILDSNQSPYKSNLSESSKIEAIQIIKLSGEVDISPKVLQKQRDIGVLTGKWINEARKLVNGPANFIDPKYLADFAIRNCQTLSLDCEVLGKTQIKSLKLNALLGVNKGSPNDPALIIIKYSPANSVGQIGLVGKGVTFDTGGLSMKGPLNLHYMKTDMAGASTVLCATLLAANLKLPVSIVAVVPCTENCVDGESIKPGDVIKAYGGKTIEIIDTDAEGRLILADALSYISDKYRLDGLVDLATLTGSIVRAVGTESAGLFTSSELLKTLLMKAAQKTGERVWPMPMWDEYANELKSETADVRNLGTTPLAGSIVAAKFLESFIQNDIPWAHLDIAGVAFGNTSFTKEKSATGYGILLIYQFLQEFILHNSA